MIMNQKSLPRPIKRKLKDLVGKSYENELSSYLKELSFKFDEWKAGNVSSGELSNLIHDYDRGPSKDMFVYYNTVDSSIAVGRAIVHNFLSEDDIPEEIFPYIKNSIELSKRLVEY
jgi:hypothetical protein